MQHITPICAFDIDPEGKALASAEPNPPLARPENGGYRWVHYDISEPNVGGWLHGQLPLTVAKALLQTETRPRCHRYEDGLLLNLRGVNLNPGANPEDMVSLRFWVADGLIITTRVRKVWAIDAIREKMVQGRGPDTVAAFLAEITHALTKRIEQVSLELEEETDELEEHMIDRFDGLSPRVAPIRQSVIKLRRFVGPQREALSRLANDEIDLITLSARHLLRETSNRAMRTVEELDATRERLAAIQDHLDVQHTIAMTRTSYILSVVATVFLPLGFITGLFGVNLGGMPGAGFAYAFLILTGACILFGVGLYLVFRWKKWL